MPRYIDAHPMKGFDEETLKKLQNSPPDEFGVTHANILYNKEQDKIFCVLNAPDKEAIENHHKKAGVKCDWIMEVNSTS